MNSQQSHLLQLQRDIIQEKKQELRQLNLKMAELGNALRRQHGNAFDPRRSLSYNKQSPGLFNGTYLQDTLSRRKHMGKPPPPPPPSTGQRDINSNVITSSPSKDRNDAEQSETSQQQLRNGMVNGSYSPNNRKSNYENSPVSGNQIWRTDPKKSLNFDTTQQHQQNKTSLLHSPTSSVSSLSSLSSASATPDELAPNKSSAFPFGVGKEAPPAPPVRTTPIGVLIDHNEPSDEERANLRAQNQRIFELQQELRKNTNVSLQSYDDSALSSSKEDLRYQPYGDASSSCSKENLTTNLPKSKPPPPAVKPKPPAISPKPSVPSKPKLEAPSNDNTQQQQQQQQPPQQNVNELEKPKAQVTVKDDTIPHDSHDKDTKQEADWPIAPPNMVNITEPDEFELSFADIDEINDMQTDMWSNSGSSAGSQSSYDSDNDSYVTAVVPVVISVSPDKMPPPILMKPDKPRKQKRNVILDPFALLLDSALEGEMEMVKRTLMQVNNYNSNFLIGIFISAFYPWNE